MQTSAHGTLAASSPAPIAPRGLTIDKGRLRDLYLPLEVEYREDCDRLDRMARKICNNLRRQADYHALHTGYYRSRTYHHEIVESIRERGGLLHIGAPGALQ